MKRVLSGIKSTGELTLGNYIGAIKNFVKLQDEYELFVFVADLHSLTVEISPEELRNHRRNVFALYIACGLDPRKATLFYQSEVPAHGQISFIMENQTTLGELNRMTQFKDKAKSKESNGTEKIRTGLLTYPALMAGDILLYQPDIVPTGKDQKQHLELTRNIAQRFNNKYGDTFKIPEIMMPKIGSKIMSLTNPMKKMSKTDESNKSYISLLDDPEIAYNKIQKAVTDSEGKIYASDEKPGITNLLTIYSSLKDIDISKAERYFENKNYGDLKKEVGEVIKTFLNNIQRKYKDALEIIDEVALKGKIKANDIANKTLEKTFKKIGLI